MRSYHANLGAGLEGLTLKDGPEPKVRPEEVLVRVRAASLNYRELMIMIGGRYPLPVKPDVIVASDGAGEIVAVGEAVTRARVGDRIVASMFPRWMDGPFTLEHAAQLGGSLDGMMTELKALREDAIVPIPEHLSFEEAATLPCAAVTAWNALTGGRPLRAGESVLTLGSGGVSLFALQFAKMFGSYVIATTSTEEKAAKLKALGVDHVIDYRASPDWPAEVREATGGRGVDHVVEVGGPATLEQSLRATAVGGEIAWVGSLAQGAPPVDVTALFNAAASLRSIAAGSRAQLVAVTRAIAVHRARPILDRVFAFEEVPAAFSYYVAGRAFGKVVIRVCP
ncbi:zinc-dependent alcohol dehydrogenase family protein [Anaeromyxobacter terrae]|uniref:zinc-dependent alcohol dehydrogenase family protein n=1 Tax=Anaeromyxobacter terrae TaxID=2925406 RepID=UPI001F56B545|nr:NAD(P)-dependent alcohol dehydrogenase [Anaeromyxobacter sp. SG22]